jgi:hypothetical protein
MSAARDVLADLDLIGARLEPVGDRLILRAGPKTIPAALVRRVREAKTDLLATLAFRKNHLDLGSYGNGDRCGKSHDGRHRTLESRIVNWVNQNPTPSPPGRCTWCGASESPSAVVLPFGTEPGTHTWLHSECWPAWQKARRADAIAALRAIDPTLKDALINDHGDWS